MAWHTKQLRYPTYWVPGKIQTPCFKISLRITGKFDRGWTRDPQEMSQLFLVSFFVQDSIGYRAKLDLVLSVANN